ncbi:hypothetical protein [Thiohalorhabdus sp.]|uniref:hypothetical protein n=1 Tax=Thiohalorhabdus sp. TaxID=3094134 RepID=UPI002FC3189C
MDADQLLDDLWDNRVPVDVERIASHWGVEVVRGDDGEGLTQIESKAGSGVQFRVPLGESGEDQRLRIAHAMGRLLQVVRGETPENPDAQAQGEALQILMPVAVMTYLFRERGIRDPEALARTLQVAPQLVQIRLKQVGLVAAEEPG